MLIITTSGSLLSVDMCSLNCFDHGTCTYTPVHEIGSKYKVTRARLWWKGGDGEERGGPGEEGGTGGRGGEGGKGGGKQEAGSTQSIEVAVEMMCIDEVGGGSIGLESATGLTYSRYSTADTRTGWDQGRRAGRLMLQVAESSKAAPVHMLACAEIHGTYRETVYIFLHT